VPWNTTLVVGILPTHAIRDLMRLPDGELRHYGFRGIVGKRLYLPSEKRTFIN